MPTNGSNRFGSWRNHQLRNRFLVCIAWYIIKSSAMIESRKHYYKKWMGATNESTKTYKKWMDRWMVGWMNEWMNKWMRFMNELINEQLSTCTNAHTQSGRMDRWMNEFIHSFIHLRTGGMWLPKWRRNEKRLHTLPLLWRNAERKKKFKNENRRAFEAFKEWDRVGWL